MAQLAHTSSHIIVEHADAPRDRGAILALLVAAAVVLALTLPGNDSSSSSATSADQPSAVPAVRSDGGPDEGTRGVPNIHSTAGLRFDGGPVEDSAGPISLPALASTGEPAEGARGTR